MREEDNLGDLDINERIMLIRAARNAVRDCRYVRLALDTIQGRIR
jgi:hypothetical protein